MWTVERTSRFAYHIEGARRQACTLTMDPSVTLTVTVDGMTWPSFFVVASTMRSRQIGQVDLDFLAAEREAGLAVAYLRVGLG